jgi:hypothetical protein
MALREVFIPSLNTTVKLGRKKPPSLGMHLRLEDFTRITLPTPPATCDYRPKANTSLRRIYKNDTLGCCVIASLAHDQGVATANAGAEVLWLDSDIERYYGLIGGYVPGDPSTDNGCDEVTALNYAVTHGLPDGSKPLGWIYIDPTKPVLVRTAIYLFERAIICAGLPDAWISPFPSGDGYTWDAGTPDMNNGHSFMAAGYDTTGYDIDSWGELGKLTDAGGADCCAVQNGGGMYCLITTELLNKAAQKAPNGFDWAGLVTAWDQMGGNLPIPAPPPPPPAPAPSPSGGITLAQAQAAAVSMFPRFGIMPTSLAISDVKQGLAKLKGWAS